MTELFMKFADASNNIAIRGMVAGNGTEYYLSVIDFINHACERTTSSDYGRTLFNRLVSKKSDHRTELMSMCKYQKLSGKIY